ncbi:type II toxin-antitoxin system HicA family toxin [Candidatus Symbiopectobacterium sp. NZEC135]|uniref:type II toxin-antitoxin system HicA family toxin n=1 Tax=Candidatus Symbiopectobacterium sp. NZEC135 TaxID=2820471 RepID=UPI00222642A5|nr:type II toxin-antitoxin system HicA family toxin [Candidatus Symbiopectobacterium sp. NZEC135]MCW2478014.1 type II toxin-antitoxin system HicA family toxin [Candidatus Symbiopectobacterium sp. NZEC135]
MFHAHELSRSHKQLLPLFEIALQEGRGIVCTSGGHLTFTKPDMSPIFTRSTISDYRAGYNPRALLRRVQNQFASPEEGGHHA